MLRWCLENAKKTPTSGDVLVEIKVLMVSLWEGVQMWHRFGALKDRRKLRPNFIERLHKPIFLWRLE